MKEPLLLTFSVNYSDEFDCEGFVVMEKDAWNKHLVDVKAMFDARPLVTDRRGDSKVKPINVYFGSNEGIEYNSYDEYVGCFSVAEITPSDSEFLGRHFKGYKGIQNGMVCMIETN